MKRYVHNFSGIENNADLAGYIVSYVVQCMRDELLGELQAESDCNIAREVLREIDCKAIAMKPELGRIIDDCLSQHLIKVDPGTIADIVDVKDLNSKFHVEPAEYYAMKAVIERQNKDIQHLKDLLIELTEERLEMSKEIRALSSSRECGDRIAIC